MTGAIPVCLTFDVDADEVWIADDPANAERPGVLSQGRFDYRFAVSAVLDLLRDTAAPATFFVPGRVAEKAPELVARMLADGHEVAHHGYTHRSPTSLSVEEEQAEMDDGLEVLRGLGAAVSGYRSPSWDFSAVTLRIVEAAGLRYSSNMMDDVRPYRHRDSTVVELPISWLLDDAAHFWFAMSSWTRKIASTEEVWSIWTEEYLGFQEHGGAFVLTMHPQIIGRPSRLRMLRRFILWLREQSPAPEVVLCRDLAGRFGPAPEARTDSSS